MMPPASSSACARDASVNGTNVRAGGTIEPPASQPESAAIAPRSVVPVRSSDEYPVT